jgi:carbamoyltransferase
METRDAPARYILGVNAGFHDSSAALLRDGELVAMAEQERLSRRRHAFFESPSKAIAACLDEAGIDLGALAEIAVGWDIPSLFENEQAGPFDEEEFTAWMLGPVGDAAGPLPPLRFVNHHLAHAASAFYTSGFSEAAILVVDGRGESVATTLATGGPGGIETIQTWGINASLGFFYAMAAEWAGMRMRDAGKLMGLAAYGESCQPVPLGVSPEGYAIDGAPSAEMPGSKQFAQLRGRLRSSFEKRNYPYGPGDLAEIMSHANFAASIQGGLEDVLLGLARTARKESGHSKLAMAGGVALNCTANGALTRAGIFDEVWIPPFPHDTGVGLGAALVAERAGGHSAATPGRMPHAFWAPATAGPDGDTLAMLGDCEVSRHDDAHLADAVAQHLEDGKLVGWHQGRAEVGQRALGARSILCDPRRREALVNANLVKGRETWRPLAPAVLADRAAAIFDGELPALADFMLAAWPVREAARAELPAAVHVDGSARPQLVRPAQRRYHDVVEAFHERTGVPAVINTSFNLAGEPIVHSASDAVGTFLESGLDVLVLDDLVAVKPPAQAEQPQKKPSDPEMGFSPPWSRARLRRERRPKE